MAGFRVSLRIDEERLLIRCRGPQEWGLAWTTAADIHLVDQGDAPGAPGELDGWSPPNELPLHVEVLRSRPEAAAVVHVHPPAVVAADLAGLAIRPIVGAFDIPAAKLAVGGVPVYPRGVLVRNRGLALEMAAAMGDRPVVVLRGHGLTRIGRSVQEATLRAISVDSLARLSLQIAAAGGPQADLPAEDLAALPDLGPGFNEGVAWQHEIARMR